MKKVVLLMLSLFLLGGCASEADLSNQVLTLLQEKSMLEPFNMKKAISGTKIQSAVANFFFIKNKSRN